ncbi:MAG: hypothetical protein HY540_05460, partial [Deltaproteobacteria bacterium]|nr:hypothetical protein [Deltaproteobacteria bacterium]
MLIHGIKSLRISGTEGAQPSSTVKTTPEEEAYPFPIPSPDGQGFLGDGAEEGFENTPVSSNPLHAFTFGETTRSAEEIQEADVSKRLNLPSFEELALGREGAPYFLTTIEKKYQGAIETLLKAETSYKESLQVHGLRSHEARAIQDKLRLVEKALDQARGELDKVHAAIERQNKTYQEELSRGIDLNGDGKVGGGPDAIGVAQDENGMTVYVDPATGKPLGKPAAFPEYKPQLVRGNGLLKIDEPIDRTSEYYRNNGQFNDQAPDLFFKVNGQFSGSGNLLESQGTIAIPEAMWVKKGPDHRPEIDVNKGGYVLFNEWDTASGITQAPPANAKDAMLVTINRMNVYSEEASTKANLGNDAAGHPILKPLYHQIIELYSNSPEGEFLVARIRIEGDFTAQAGHPPAAAPITPTDGHSGYIAASTIPLIFTGDPDANGEGGRWNPLITDLSHMESTGRAVFND